MAATIHFSAELGDWIQHNLARGCSLDVLVSSMQEQGFQPEVASALVAAFMTALAQGAALPQGSISIEADTDTAYVYELPRLAAGTVLQTPDRAVSVALRLSAPALAVLENVISADECEALMALARPRLRPSTVVDPETGEERVEAHRDSEGMFFQLSENPLIARLDQRISALMNMPLENGEGLQVLRYGPGTQSTPHFDFLIPSNATNQASLARSGQRVSTLVIYLNTVESGGETVFPELGLSVSPQQGNAVYFEYCNSLNQLDSKSLHAGAPVQQGEKWVLTKWMRQRRFVPALS